MGKSGSGFILTPINDLKTRQRARGKLSPHFRQINLSDMVLSEYGRVSIRVRINPDPSSENIL
jgi:hypothetical protein